MDPVVDIEFDCLPLRSVGRVDVPLDASPAFRARCERLQQAIDAHDSQCAYFLYNAHCTYRLANSEIANMLRFTFDGTVLTDRSDYKAERADLAIELTAETCGGVPPAALDWLRGVVTRRGPGRIRPLHCRRAVGRASRRIGGGRKPYVHQRFCRDERVGLQAQARNSATHRFKTAGLSHQSHRLQKLDQGCEMHHHSA